MSQREGEAVLRCKSAEKWRIDERGIKSWFDDKYGHRKMRDLLVHDCLRDVLHCTVVTAAPCVALSGVGRWRFQGMLI